MRIRIVHRPPDTSIDGIRLDRFEPGREYEVGNTLASLFLAEGWAEPVDLDKPAPPVPFSDSDPFDSRRLYRREEPNLVREKHPPSDAKLDRAAEYKRRRHKKPR